MAQDFYAAFNVGEDDRHITSIDEDGVALAAIKALNALSKQRDLATKTELAHRDAEIRSLRDEVQSRDEALARKDASLGLKYAALQRQMSALLAQIRTLRGDRR
jgi:DNA-binding transcriptional MerR regulator